MKQATGIEAASHGAITGSSTRGSTQARSIDDVSVHRAVVRNGRLVLDEPTTLPEGKVVELEEADPYPDQLDLDEEQRRRLDGMIDEGMAEARAGRTVSATEFIDELDKQ